ncbi:N-acetylglucosaminyltransferase [Microbulbifer flavimaris]|uniref:N-acetylglucosaminyltransferase n=1 Tax=Microbulbifer flavimaris TaxID=1781068 RepID=A0ABX4HXT0_9GAMM|nr:N-acetylglucosaminyltransferase [Microbulbifer sp. ZGT114]PCO04927.1 N-acetylglucosaminyltransferase [Microbulbifer flavimaris]
MESTVFAELISCRRIGILLAGVLLAGCVTTPPLPAPRAVPLPESAKPAGPTPEQIRQRNIAFFLQRAEAAQREGFLTQPAGASAFDYYLRVRQLDPDNSRAATGIQTIVIELVERAREALRRRSFGEVNSYLNRADELAPGNPLVTEVRTQLASERSRASSDLPQGENISLPGGSLASRNEAVIALLRETAERIRRENLRVMIVARTDAEGRWIYQQLREAVMGYRVRGDIRLGSPPRLILMSTGGT